MKERGITITNIEGNKLNPVLLTAPTCGRNKGQNGFGRRMRVICGKPAKFQQEDGLPLCEYHFKKWFKKNYGLEYKDFIGGCQ